MAALAPSDKMVHVLVASDQPLRREAMSRVMHQGVEFQLLAEVARGSQTIDSITRLRPGVAIVESSMAGLDPARLLKVIGRERLRTRIVFFLDDGRPATAYEALALGATGILSKYATTDDIREATLRASKGVATIDPLVHTDVATAIRMREHVARPALSPRELQVLELAAGGVSAPSKAAAVLGISTRTVRTHWESIYEKLGVSDRAAAVARAMRLGLLD